MAERGERGEQGGVAGGPGVESEGGPGHESQRPFRTDHQLGEVVAAGRLSELSVGHDHFAGAEDGLDPEHMVPGHAVFDGSHPSGVGRQVAAQGGRRLAREDGIDQPVGEKGGIQFGQGDAGFHHGHLILGVNVEYPGHPFERHHHTSVHRDTSPRQPGPRAPRREGHAVDCGCRHDGGNLIHRARSHHGDWSDRLGGERFIVGVFVLDGLSGADVGGTDDIGYAGEEGGHDGHHTE